MKTLKINQAFNQRLRAVLAVACLAATAVSSPAQTQSCTDTNAQKFYLPPQTAPYEGFDVKDSRQNIVLADDFLCTSPGPITGIHIWGSWLYDQHGSISNFWIGIYSDVPAVTNSNGQIITNSHPGTLLWSNNFFAAAGQFTETPYTNVYYEYFYDASNNIGLGQDTQVYQYCFYPTNPFVQQGTAAAPINYWLAIRAYLYDTNTQIIYGWKSAATNYNDPAVWGILSGDVPTGYWQSITNPNTGQPMNLSMLLTTTNPPTQTLPCPEGNGNKVLFPPQTTYGGLDVRDGRQGIVLADDFPCTSTGPITDIHVWGSWSNNIHGFITNFWLGIYDDVPVSPTNGYSHPGNLLWQESFPAGQFSETNVSGSYSNVYEYFYDPINGSYLPETNVWYYCFYPTNPFVQQGGVCQTNIYWLAIRAQLTNDGTYYGWKTSTSNYNDAAVWGTTTNGLPLGNWQSITNVVTGNPANLSFKLNTQIIPPLPCVETNGVKYIQLPDPEGLDVWNNPYVLADDFVCTNAGLISDIHIWGSWLNDNVSTNTLTFWLGIYDDVPVSSTNPYSHPGNLLWQQWFSPGQYAENFSTFGQESFLDPGVPQVIGADTELWYYCFYPTNPPVQIGQPTAPKTYWLAVYAQPPTGSTCEGLFGWKTTPSVQNDASVHAPWPGGPPTANPGWTPTSWQPPSGGSAVPLDLAFKITTVTNRCPFGAYITCSPDTNVQCGTAWTFGPTNVFDPCCSSWVTYSDSINILGPCQVQYTRTWFLFDCIGFEGYCSQTVTVVDTIPPLFTSFPSNIIVATCNTNVAVSWSVTATNTCNTNSVTVTSVPPSGSSFPHLSTNTVTVTATDACGNTNIQTFTVSVVRPVLSRLSISYLGTNNYLLTWTNGILQVSTATNLMTTNVSGPYVDVPSATSPYITSNSLPASFYRLRCN